MVEKYFPKKKVAKDDGTPSKTEETILGADFYSQECVELSKALLGKIIVRETPSGIIKTMIVETEAYCAPEDKACHAYNNKKTERTKYFWQDGGHLYVYSIYGSNCCMNITASDASKPEAVLLRAVEPISGIDIIKSNRKVASKKIKDLTNGPGKICKAIEIDKSFNGFDLRKKGGIYLIDNPGYTFEMGISKRINIDYAEEWKDKLWRFFIKGNEFVSV